MPGFSILYLSVYAAFNYYDLVPQVAAFALMSGVTMITLWQSLKYDSLAVALLGWAGGFLTPIMLSTDVPNVVGLFTYIALLDAVLLAIVLSKRKWIVLEVLALLGTSLLYLAWFVDSYQPQAFTSAIYFLTIFWILFLVAESVRTFRGGSTRLEVRHGNAVGGALLYLVGMYTLIDTDYHVWMGLITLLIGVPYYFLFIRVRITTGQPPTVVERNILLAIFFLVTATTIQFEMFITVCIWSVEAAVVLWAGARLWKLRSVWISGLIILAVGTFKLIFSQGVMEFDPLEEFVLLLNLRSLAFASLVCALYVSAEILRSNGNTTSIRWAGISTYAAAIIGLIFVTVETNDLFGRQMIYVEGDDRQVLAYKRSLSLGMVWMGYSIILCWGGIRRRLEPLTHVSVGAAALAICTGIVIGISFDPIVRFSPMLNYRVFALVFLLGGVLVLIHFWKSATTHTIWKGVVVSGLSLSVVGLLLVILTGETWDFFEQRIHNVELQEWSNAKGLQIQQRENLQHLSLSGTWLFFSIVLMVVGLWKRHRNVRLVAIGLFGITILKIFIYDLSFLETLYRIFSFMGLGVILLGVSYLYQKYKGIILEAEEDVEKGV